MHVPCDAFVDYSTKAAGQRAGGNEYLPNTEEKAIRHQRSKEALDAIMGAVGTCAEYGKDDDDNSRDKERISARPGVAEVAKGELANDGTYKGDRGDIILSVGLGVLVFVKRAEHGVDGTNDLRNTNQSN